MGEASLDMELGEYAAARALVRAHPRCRGHHRRRRPIAEVTGDLPRAQVLLGPGGAARRRDLWIANERRAWFHVRLGELAFEAGDAGDALREEAVALARFPDDAQALTDTRALRRGPSDRWSERARERGSCCAPHTVTGEPGPPRGRAKQRLAMRRRRTRRATRSVGGWNASATRSTWSIGCLAALLRGTTRCGRTDAYAIARRDAAARPDVYAEDTLAWAAARAGRWDVGSARRPARGRLEHPRSADLVSRRGYRRARRRSRTRAGRRPPCRSALNPHFQPVFADDARMRVARLEQRERRGNFAEPQ